MPVVYLADGERLIVIGSNAGHKTAPAWSLNLEANPVAEVELGGERRKVRARIAEGEERAELWRKMNEQLQRLRRLQRAHDARDPAVRARAALIEAA